MNVCICGHDEMAKHVGVSFTRPIDFAARPFSSADLAACANNETLNKNISDTPSSVQGSEGISSSRIMSTCECRVTLAGANHFC